MLENLSKSLVLRKALRAKRATSISNSIMELLQSIMLAKMDTLKWL